MTPAEFAFFRLGLRLYPWQVETVEAVGRRRPTALVAANGSGKTAAVNVALLLWFLAEHPQGIAMVTSGSWRFIVYRQAGPLSLGASGASHPAGAGGA